MRENKLEGVQTHARYLITGSNVGMIFALSLVISALFPFMDTDLTSNALLIGLMIAIIVPCLFVIITGPLWVPDARKRQVVQFIAAMFTFITCLVFMIDLFSVDEWVGLPLVQWLGLQWTYSYHPVMFFFSALLGNLFISSTGFFDSNVEPYKRDKNSLLMGTVTVIGLGWILVSLFLHVGAIWGLAVMLVLAAIQAIFLFASIITGAGNGDRVVNSLNSGDAINDGSTKTPGSIKEMVKNGRNGTLHVVKAFLSFLPIFAMIMANTLIVNQLLPKPNYLPLWIDFFPFLFLGSVFFVILAKIIKKRFMMLFPPLILLLLLALVSISTPYAMEYKHTTLLLLSGFSLPGAVLAGTLHARHMATGRFSKIAWGAIATFMMVGAFVYGISVKSEVYDELGWQIAIASCLVGIPLFIIGRFMSSMKGFWNKGLRTRRSRAAMVEGFTSGKEITSTTTQSRPGTAGRAFKWDDTAKMTTILVFSLAMVTATIIPVLVTSSGTTEHVLGTYKGEYYLWEASSLRNIDASYRPNLAASPVNATARISMARGEHEGIQVIFTPRKIKNLNVLSFEPTTDLIHQGAGPSIDKGNITVFNVGYVSQLGKQYPDQLHPFTPLDTSISVSPQSNYPFYIDVFIPRNDSFEPGIYQATMKFHCRDYRAQPPGIERQYIHRDVTFTLEVEVYNFTVPLERHVATEIIWSIPEEEQWWDFYADHRLDWNMKHDLVTGLNVNSSLGPLSISFDWAPFIAKLNESFNRGTRYFPVALGFLSQYNIPGLNWNTLDLTTDEEIVFTWYIGNITEQLSNRTTPWGTPWIDHAYYFIRDEPPEIYDEKITEIANLIYNVSTDITGNSSRIRVMETLNRDLHDYADGFLESIDIYCTHIHHWEPAAAFPEATEPEGVPLILQSIEDADPARTRELWVYHTHNRFPTPDTDIYMSGIMHRNSFWLHWIYGVPGWLYWSFNYGMDMDGGYGYAGFGESNLVDVGPGNTPVSSLRLERVRDGIEDYEYFWLLNETIDGLITAGTNMSLDLAGNATILLDRVASTFNQPEHLNNLPVLDTDDLELFKRGYNPYSGTYLSIRDDIGALLGTIKSEGY